MNSYMLGMKKKIDTFNHRNPSEKPMSFEMISAMSSDQQVYMITQMETLDPGYKFGYSW